MMCVPDQKTFETETISEDGLSQTWKTAKGARRGFGTKRGECGEVVEPVVPTSLNTHSSHWSKLLAKSVLHLMSWYALGQSA